VVFVLKVIGGLNKMLGTKTTAHVPDTANMKTPAISQGFEDLSPELAYAFDDCGTSQVIPISEYEAAVVYIDPATAMQPGYSITRTVPRLG
jgi:hypothetical protein